MSALDKSHLSADQLLDLAHGLATESEKAAAYRHLKKCSSCSIDFKRHAATRLRNEAGSVTPQSGKRTPLWGRWWLGLAAASILVAIVVFPGLGPEEPPYSMPELVLDGTKRFEPSTGLDRFYDGIERYKEGEFALVETALEGANVPDNFENLRVLYLASALQHLKKNEEAQALLESTQLNAYPSIWRHRAYWMLVTLADDDQSPEIQELLLELSVDSAEFAERAKERLREQQ